MDSNFHVKENSIMTLHQTLIDTDTFIPMLFEKMKLLSPAVAEMEFYEFCYGLDNLVPSGGWLTVSLDEPAAIERLVNDIHFYRSIQIKPRRGERIVLDERIVALTNMLLVGLASGVYPPDWVNQHFYFDVRGFYFLHRTAYFTNDVKDHFGGVPLRQFEPKQRAFEQIQDLGYKAFKDANVEVDQFFIESVKKLTASRPPPALMAIAGPTAAGKTEIVERLRQVFADQGCRIASVELDNFLTDRDYREEKGIFTQGKEALHFELLKQSLSSLLQGRKVSIPRYDFVYATSSHDLQGNLKPDGIPIEVEPADIIFIEGNFPFLIDEVARMIGIKVVYLTDDPVRLKRKWKRDIDYRKKYEPTYFRNRYFKDQFIMAEIAYRPQLKTCDLAVDTTGAAIWATPETARIIGS
jgi:uridine kinase